jgi:GNAT superfamily N-acetyltransferase
MQLVIRHANPIKDSEYISNLIEICIEEKSTVLNPYSAEEERIYLKNLQKREVVFVAYLDVAFAGFAGISPRWSYSERHSHCGECGTWVMPEFRGLGVGRRLWELGILPWCNKMGFTHLGAMVMAHNTGSITFYEKMGFKVVGYHNKVVRWDNIYLDAVEIECILE